MSAAERDCAEASAVVAYAIQRIAPIAEEIFSGRQRVMASGARGYASQCQAMDQVSGKIEQGVASALRRLEEGAVGLVLRHEGSGELRPDFVGVGANTRADDRVQSFAPSAQPLHRRDRA